MADPRFFTRQGPFRLTTLAAHAGATLAPGADKDYPIEDVAPLSAAGPCDISFFDNRRYLAAFRATKAGACIVAPRDVGEAPQGVQCLVSAEPYKAYARIAQAFYPRPGFSPGIAPGAHVDREATLGAGCAVAPGAVIEHGAALGAACYVGPNAVIGAGVVVSEGCWIGAHVSLSHALIGARVTLHPGVRIGQDGFGLAPDPKGHVKVPQIGRVIIGDDVEIGANTTIDRGSLLDTEIGSGTWIDNLVQIGHNVKIGRGCVIVAQVGISGSTEIGDFAMVGGQAGLVGHLKIGPRTRIAAQSGVVSDLEGGREYGGTPAVPLRQWLREAASARAKAKLGGRRGR